MLYKTKQLLEKMLNYSNYCRTFRKYIHKMFINKKIIYTLKVKQILPNNTFSD